MERLTRKYENTNWYDYKCQIKTEQIVDKLGKLEDIMEKYNIKSIEELEKVLSNHEEYQSSLNVIKDKGSCGFCEHLDNERIKFLEKALELSCDYVIDEWAGTELDDIAEKMGGFKNYFIEQAKKELEEQ